MSSQGQLRDGAANGVDAQVAKAAHTLAICQANCFDSPLRPIFEHAVHPACVDSKSLSADVPIHAASCLMLPWCRCMAERRAVVLSETLRALSAHRGPAVPGTGPAAATGT